MAHKCPKCNRKKIVTAVKLLKERRGASTRQVTKFVAKEFNVKPVQVIKAIKKEVARKRLIQTRSTGSTGLLFLAPVLVTVSAPKKKSVTIVVKKKAPAKKIAKRIQKKRVVKKSAKRVVAKRIVKKARNFRAKAVVKAKAKKVNSSYTL